ncbi:MAG: hypothetical protein NT120_01745 [Candidatus Aenigmarchaeota archaeon]|nr:hypothetical protein [Candidatus Aenigmarchaeota archaeon]
MSKPHILSAIESLSQGARLAVAEMIVSHPTPFSASFAKNTNLETESFSAALNAAIGAELGGKRTFVFGQVNSLDDMNHASYMRLPLVMGNVSRSLGTYSTKQDHSDIMSVRDTGWIIFMPQNNQETLETIIQAYKVSETSMLPSVVNIDMPYISETVTLPNEKYCHKFVSKPSLNFLAKKSYIGVGLDNYSDYKKEQQKAMTSALETIEKTSELWKKNTRRALPLVEQYKTEDADYVIVIAGYHSQTARVAIDKMRATGTKVGLLRLRVLRPFPAAQIVNALANAKKVAVVDQAVSLGSSGILYNELKPLLKHIASFISLGVYMNEKHFVDIITHLSQGKEETVWL